MVFKNQALALSIPLLAIIFNLNKKTWAPISNSQVNVVYFDGVILGVPPVDTSDYYTNGTEVLPAAIKLDMPVPGDQGMQRSCGAWATVYGAGNYYMHVNTGKAYSDSANLNPGFIYNQLSKGRCGITSLLDNLLLFKNEGSCSMKAMPYNYRDCATQPDSMQLANAKSFKIKGWEKIDPYSILILKSAVAKKKPVIFSIVIDEGFDKITAPFIWKNRCGRLEQTHTMVVAGYDDARNAFLVMNSWGTAWGEKGFIWIDYKFFADNVLPDSYILI
ncbi:MAG: C1 family peptidase [Bacteroidota bacterium]|nr:C1 family peptidase [Bacteroidota bacterium]